MKPFNDKLPIIGAYALIFAAAFINALVPITSDDFWWHLKTGDYIISSRSLPEEDLFTYPPYQSTPDDAHRVSFLMTQYWLTQLLFAGIVKFAGFTGLIAARGLLYACLAVAVYFLIRQFTTNAAAGIMLFPFIFAIRTAFEDSDRPQMFSFLAVALIVAAIEWVVRNKRPWPLFIINIPVMLIAANMHGGYIVAVAVLAVYAVTSCFEERLKPLRRERGVSDLRAPGACPQPDQQMECIWRGSF